jgi:hypothetical protein
MVDFSLAADSLSGRSWICKVNFMEAHYIYK